jgi:virulence-associated protein VagC
MKAKVTRRGLAIPKEMLVGMEEVEIRKEDQRIVISPIPKADPIFALGKHPVECGMPDGAEHHDRYLYGYGT